MKKTETEIYSNCTFALYENPFFKEIRYIYSSHCLVFVSRKGEEKKIFLASLDLINCPEIIYLWGVYNVSEDTFTIIDNYSYLKTYNFQGELIWQKNFGDKHYKYIPSNSNDPIEIDKCFLDENGEFFVHIKNSHILYYLNKQTGKCYKTSKLAHICENLYTLGPDLFVAEKSYHQQYVFNGLFNSNWKIIEKQNWKSEKVFRLTQIFQEKEYYVSFSHSMRFVRINIWDSSFQLIKKFEYEVTPNSRFSVIEKNWQLVNEYIGKL